MTIKVILNPYSNRWNSRKRWAQVETSFNKVGISYDLVISEHADHIVDLASDAIKNDYSTILIAGGDGSIGEAINGIAKQWDEKSKFPATVGVIPLGTANDLVDNIGLPQDFMKVANMVTQRKTRMLDLGKCNDKYFVNNSAVGLEPFVTVKQEKIKLISGIPRYLLAAVLSIMEKPSWNVKMEWDGGSYEGPLTLISVGNGKRTGGVFYMTPHADPFDGKLTFIYGYRGSRRSMFSALPSAMKADTGNISEVEGIMEVHATHLKFSLDKPSPAHTDGELFDTWAQDFEYKLFPATVPIIVP